jgi:hypothetical protein
VDKDLMNLLEKYLHQALEINTAQTANEFTAGGMAFALYGEIEELGVLGEETE